MLAVSSRLGPYEIVATLGIGGMGEVYRARDTRLDREVAVKVLPELFADDPGRLARFDREARAVAALSHPNILAIHDYGTHEGITYAVMELLEGETLRVRLAKGPMPWREAVQTGTAIADGLAAAHAKSIVHRDLKPENLFLTNDGRVKILDFGLARIAPPAEPQLETTPHVAMPTDPGTVMGTVGYMSPEQVRGETVDAPSDLFSFGCVLYEMVTGERAFCRNSPAETMTAILRDEPPDLGDVGRQIPAELSRLIRHCLAKNVNQRLHSARDLALALRSTGNSSGLQPPASQRSVDAVAVLPFENLGGDPRFTGLLRDMGLPHDAQSAPQVAAVPRRSRLAAWVLAALILVTLIAASAYLLKRGGGDAVTGNLSLLSKEINALAVVPLENVGGDPKTEPLSETIADYIINSLSQVRRATLKVRPLTSVSKYKGQKPDFPTIGRELSVQVVVTVAAQQKGNDFSIKVALVDARDDNNLWGKRYEGNLGGILDLQDQIAREVAANLRLHLTGEEEQRLTKRYTEDPEAYRLYREGVYHAYKFSPVGLNIAAEYFRGRSRRTRITPWPMSVWPSAPSCRAPFMWDPKKPSQMSESTLTRP